MWQAIVRRAFTPGSDRDYADWICAFMKSVRAYINDNPVCDNGWTACYPFIGRFGHQSLLTCRYQIEPKRSQFDIYQPEWIAQYGTDSTVFACPPQTDERVDKVKPEEVECVLRGMIEHPRAHLHLFKDTKRHEVRIGSGLADPCLFLFQLRFQLCLDQARRDRELTRLRDIFTPDWFQDRNVMSPWRLFGL